MKRLLLVIVAFSVALFWSCDSPSTIPSPPTVPAQSTTPQTETQRTYAPAPKPSPIPTPTTAATLTPTPTQAPTLTPALTPKPTPTPYEKVETYHETQPLKYEVVKSYTDLDSYKVWRSGAGDVTVKFPIGCVVVKNTDSAVGTVRIQFTFYVLAKYEVETLTKGLGKPLEGLVKDSGSKYYGSGSLSLEPGKTETVRYNIKDKIADTNKIIWDYMLWEWEYTVTEATKVVEKNRTVTDYR